jgi:hypothetical protein
MIKLSDLATSFWLIFKKVGLVDFTEEATMTLYRIHMQPQCKGDAASRHHGLGLFLNTLVGS